MQFVNTLSRSKETFTPLTAGEVRMYTCGPTVYDFAHIGNFRAYMFEDLLRRHLKCSGYRVTQVMNLTDIDDKTIRASREQGIPLAQHTQVFKDAFFADLATLRIERAEFYPAATAHIPEMIALIARLLEKGVAYQSDDKCVYFSIAKFPQYGRLARLDLQELKAGARVAQDEYEKESASDFALWKAWDEQDGAVGWDAPWGKGRPGWHIECSAMSMKYLGETFDIHTGGVDNIFPHHEDEIAQSEAATGKRFVNYWLHCAHLMVEGRKMSKSLGNFYTLRDILAKGYTGREVRYLLLSAHYRQPLNFTFDGLQAARSALQRLDDLRAKLAERRAAPDPQPLHDHVRSAVAAMQHDWAAALDDDLNISPALASLFAVVHQANVWLQDGALSSSDADHILRLLDDTDRVLAAAPEAAAAPAEVLRLVEERTTARREKNWTRSDEIRAALAALGFTVEDTPAGPRVKHL